MKLTTRGRKTGRPRTVKVWFAVAGPRSIYVQHASASRAHWYQNLRRHPEVSVDFGSGPIMGRARPLDDRAQIGEVLRLIRRKYPLAWLFQWLGRNRQAVAAEITLSESSTPP